MSFDWTTLALFLGIYLPIFGLWITVIFFLYQSIKGSRDFAQEMKDYHGRLCTLEERYFQMMLEKRGD